MVWEKIKEYKQEGLSWGETYELQPVAYGIMKLVMTCTIVDSLGMYFMYNQYEF